MSPNVGVLDRALRLAIAGTMLWLLTLDSVQGFRAVLAGAIALAMVVTALAGTCPLYRLLGWTTCATPRRRDAARREAVIPRNPAR